jgi:hypothetical protein
VKRIIITITVLSFLILATCGTVKIKEEPKIDVKFNVTNVTKEEFQCIGTRGLGKVTKDDFKNIEFILDVKHSKKLSKRNISIPDFKSVVNSYDKQRYRFGDSSQDNQEESASYYYKFVFYSKGLDEEQIRNIFSSSEVKVSWLIKHDVNEERVYNLGEIMQFN